MVMYLEVLERQDMEVVSNRERCDHAEHGRRGLHTVYIDPDFVSIWFP